MCSEKIIFVFFRIITAVFTQLLSLSRFHGKPVAELILRIAAMTLYPDESYIMFPVDTQEPDPEIGILLFLETLYLD